MTMKTPVKTRETRRKEFKAWRVKEGLSIQTIVDKVNLSKRKAVLSNAQVTAWEVRGNAPEPEAVEAVRAIWKDCPL